MTRYAATPARRNRRHADDALRAWEQACRQSWRALALVIKAKLEAVEAGISTVDDEFLAHVLLPNGATVGETLGPELDAAAVEGRMPSLIPGLRSLEQGRSS